MTEEEQTLEQMKDEQVALLNTRDESQKAALALQVKIRAEEARLIVLAKALTDDQIEAYSFSKDRDMTQAMIIAAKQGRDYLKGDY